VAVAVLAAVQGDAELSRFGALAPISWLCVPLGLAALWLVARVLLGVDRSHDDGQSGFGSCSCPHCGREVLGRWRLCPYCGSRLEDLGPESHV
jgi:hypothetical protein